MELTREMVVGRPPLEIAELLGYARADVRGVSVEPDRVDVTVEASDRSVLTAEFALVGN